MGCRGPCSGTVIAELAGCARRAATPEGRLREAQQNEDAACAEVQLKHFAKSLHSSQLTQPAQVRFLG